jgi:hypothetical protein
VESQEMKVPDAIVEVFWQAYESLNKNQRKSLASRILVEEELSEDLIDHILIERSRREKGEDISLEKYLKARKEAEAI